MCKNCYDSGICISCVGTGYQMIGSIESEERCPECDGTGNCQYCSMDFLPDEIELEVED